MSEHRSERQRARSGANPAMSARAKSEVAVHEVLIERVLLAHRAADVRYDCR
jgi:hypothetical protein